MYLDRLHIYRVRNLNEIQFSPHPQFNVFVGRNGSGKTSLLEAIHFLAIGRTFRSLSIHSVISYHQSALACYGEAINEFGIKIPIGIEKTRQGDMKCKVGGENCERLSTFATTLPLQLITPETFRLLLAGPEERRKFLDWGVFHVEHRFAELCQRYQRLLKQRNAALKQILGAKSLPAWDNELASVGEQIASFRQLYLVELHPFITRVLRLFLPSLSIDFSYRQGWSQNTSLLEALFEALPQDQRRGFTGVGPHRAELAISVENFPAQQILSRGQQKMLISALHIAQALQLREKLGKKCLFLIDDLSSELDQENRYHLLHLLAEEGHQTFLTGMNSPEWGSLCEQFAGKMFHVEHGVLSTSER